MLAIKFRQCKNMGENVMYKILALPRIAMPCSDLPSIALPGRGSPRPAWPSTAWINRLYLFFQLREDF